MPSAVARCVLGFTQDIRLYMQLSDFFIGKPGPGSISEALQQRLPVIVVRNGSTMPQERYNTDWVRENNVGIVLKSFDAIDQGVAELQQRRQELDASIGKLQNRAIFEIPDILATILQSSRTIAEPGYS
jgi:UDP-N-acetylglucosamine:LPS N-acetylglucosamine transferase